MALQQTSKIAESCHSFADLASLARTNRWFYRVLNPLLYKLDVRSGSPCALFWACQVGSLETLKLVHKAGAALNQAWASKEPLRDLPPNPYRHSPDFYQKVALRLTDPADDKDNSDEATNNGWPEIPDVVPGDFTNEWDQNPPDQAPEEPVEEEQNDEESDTEWVVDEGPWEEPYELEEAPNSEEDHLWPKDKDEAGQPLLKTASQDSRYTWRNDFFHLKIELERTDNPDFAGENPLSRDPRLHPLFWWHPIDLAVYFGRKEIIRYLVANGVRVQHGMSRGLCRQKDISFASPDQGCDRDTLLLVMPERPDHADFKYLVHALLGLVACKEPDEGRDMEDFLREVHGWNAMQMRLAGLIAWAA
ncbi:hypothetical protein B0H65DRAFT_570827 [Neurospora tetraspora]|uniref:Ankyrin n=1 Tax=Neurospora tetraspora TaxID=94610 RepID=A0AAE0JHE2_9PEZI|nr:hypothetical protein B0H65DRAFT_570827 [Neurospora tetraspora]